MRARSAVFTRKEAVRLGATHSMIQRRLDAGRWERIHPGVYRLAGVPEWWRQSLRAACLACKGTASHRSAAALWKLAGFEERVVEVSVRRGRSCHLCGIVAHEVRGLPAVDITMLHGIPVTTPARTIIDVASAATPEALEIALDDALRRNLVSTPRLQWRLSEIGNRGRPGVGLLRSLIDARSGNSPATDSVLEDKWLRVLARSGLPMPVCQYPVRDHGRIVAIVDFAWPEFRVALEADGYRWHSGKARWQSDLERRNRLTYRGWHVIHVTWEDLDLRSDEVVRGIGQSLAQAQR